MGRYLSAATLLVGNVSVGWYQAPPSLVVGPTNTYLHAPLPLTSQLQPGWLYDIKVINEGGELLLPRRVSYSNRTLLASVDRCSARGVVSELGCEAGQSITIRGYLFPAPSSSSITVTITSAEYPNSLSSVCLTPSVLDSTTLVCIPPFLSSLEATEQLYGLSSTVQVVFEFTDGLLVTNALPVDLFVYPSLPYVSNVTGCGLQDGLRNLSQCQSGDVLTLSGGHLELPMLLGASTYTEPIDVYAGSSTFDLLCLLLPADNGSVDINGNIRTRQCQLPLFNAKHIDGDIIQEGERYAFFISYEPYTLMEAFSLDFSSTQHSPAPSSSLPSGAVVGIVIAALGTVAVALALACSKWWSKLRARSGAEESHGSSGRWGVLHNRHDVELPAHAQ